MGMFSEIHAMSEAEGLDKVLMSAIKNNNVDVLLFCKEHIYPLYDNACGETFSNQPSTNYKEIEDYFKDFTIIKPL